eukprot:scaffold143826_cov193-Phaeocystis_antarctica.AAC.2
MGAARSHARSRSRSGLPMSKRSRKSEPLTSRTRSAPVPSTLEAMMRAPGSVFGAPRAASNGTVLHFVQCAGIRRALAGLVRDDDNCRARRRLARCAVQKRGVRACAQYARLQLGVGDGTLHGRRSH